MSTWRILEVSVPVLPRLEEWLSHTYSFSCWLNTDCKREGPTLSAKFAVPWEVLELPYLLHTLSPLPGDCPVTARSCLGHTGRWLRAAPSPAVGQQGSERLANGQETAKRPYSHTAHTQFPWARQGTVHSTLFQHPQPNHRVPLRHVWAWNNTCLTRRPKLCFLQDVFNAKNACMAEHVSVFQMSQI